MAYDDILPGGTTSHIIEVFARDTSTGQGKTGLAYTAITARYQRQGASALTSISVVDGTLGSFVSGGWKELGLGWYQFGVPNAALQAGVGGVGLSFHASGMIDISKKIILTTSNLRVSTPAVAPGGNGGLATVGSAMTLEDGAITAAKVATGAIDADAIATDAAQEIADALLDRASAVDGYTVRQLLRIIGAALAGEVSGAGTTTVVFRDVADTKTRITATVDADGNRTALVIDAT